jgi:putative ABC transport system permease protein
MNMGGNNFKLAYQSLKHAKARSFLTMLGIVIGVMSVVLVVCIGQGIKEQISGQLGRYGKDVISITPGVRTASGLNSLTGLAGGSSSLLSESDLHTIQKTPGVAEAVPLAVASGTMTGDHTVTSPFIVATNAGFPDIVNQPFTSGGFFDDSNGSKSVVLGANVAQKLFNNNAPLGQGLVWRGQRFLVSGVYDYFNAPPFSLEANFDNAIFVPYSTAQQLDGNSLAVYQILARANNVQSTPQQVVSSVNTSLVASHGGSQDVTVARASDSHYAPDQTIHLLTVLVTAASIVALVVGGVGIMNVMLVSVTERMHEIGLRKAIGATNQQIMRQFTAEAFVLSAFGAIFGLVLSVIGVGLARAYTSIQAVLVWQVMIIAPLIAIAIGVFFGSLPALKAARKDPIDALRHE